MNSSLLASEGSGGRSTSRPRPSADNPDKPLSKAWWRAHYSRSGPDPRWWEDWANERFEQNSKAAMMKQYYFLLSDTIASGSDSQHAKSDLNLRLECCRIMTWENATWDGSVHIINPFPEFHG